MTSDPESTRIVERFYRLTAERIEISQAIEALPELAGVRRRAVKGVLDHVHALLRKVVDAGPTGEAKADSQPGVLRRIPLPGVGHEQDCSINVLPIRNPTGEVVEPCGRKRF